MRVVSMISSYDSALDAALLLQSGIMPKIYCSSCGSHVAGKDEWIGTGLIEWVPKCRSCRERDAADELEKYKKQIELEKSKMENETARQKLENDMRRRDAADELEKYKKQIELEISKTENETVATKQKLKFDMEQKLKEKELAAKQDFENVRVAAAETKLNIKKREQDLKIKDVECKREKAKHEYLSEIEHKKICWDKEEKEKELVAKMQVIKIESQEKINKYVADKKAEAVKEIVEKKSESMKEIESQRLKALETFAARREAFIERLALKSTAAAAEKFADKIVGEKELQMELEKHKIITKRTSVCAESPLGVKKNLEDDEIEMSCTSLLDPSAIESDKAATIISQGSLSKTSFVDLELATVHDNNRSQPNDETEEQKTEKTAIDLRMKLGNEDKRLELIKKVISHGQFEPEALS